LVLSLLQIALFCIYFDNISLRIHLEYTLFDLGKVTMCVCVCVCARARVQYSISVNNV